MLMNPLAVKHSDPPGSHTFFSAPTGVSGVASIGFDFNYIERTTGTTAPLNHEIKENRHSKGITHGL